MTLSIIGAGAFGTALAVALAANGPVTLWGRDAGKLRNNPRLPGITLPSEVAPTTDLAQATRANTIILALPAQALGGFLAEHGAALDGKPLVSAAKGIDLTTLTGPSQLIARHCPAAIPAVLTGPSFAADIARGLPTALTLACADPVTGEALQHRLSTQVLRLYRSTDVTGAELGGALKNVVAIAAGAVMGARLGDSARAAIITRGFAEMTRLATHLGAQPQTLTGLSGLGDLTLTCTSDQSRNYRFGFSLGAGSGFDAATTVEGAATAQAVTALARKLGLDLPITAAVSGLVTGGISVEKLMLQLLNRPLKDE
ncbi:NAD(P)-dependent glycerol-3-phosphate dehydrogenase [Paracoccus sp. M683]|uniref:NAD(P)H-dependent glycerol-3-phosphate dehydrogenase n=1 Tax=Paracoccus sp. M683 TaxID=2594268 RepID=UPI00117BEA23|nr:NAD(P)H-dependent glycerol-3-phosphate dehydrogenase [Paracoccus sp. M683]TRW99510.1 NAD(P)-dependent glycerol-3-phosphate dehydrogenase [Paracoccus sp. M683]